MLGICQGEALAARGHKCEYDEGKMENLNHNFDVIELRLPLKADYLAVLRATVGVIGGVLSFNYGEIMQLRVVVSEVFNLAIKHVTPAERISEVHELDVRFSIQHDKIEIVIAGPKDYTNYLNTQEGGESLALLRSLIDEVEFGAEVVGKTVVRMVKYRPSLGEPQRQPHSV